MDTKYQDKEKVIEYLSVIRDAEINKPQQEIDEELIKACVGLLLYLQDKNAELTPEQINEAVEQIPFVGTETIVNIKKQKKKVNKFKLFLIAAIIPIILTILTLMATADIDWSYFKTLKELFDGVDKTPVGEIINDGDNEIEKFEISFYETPEEFTKNYDIDILVPGEKFTQNKLIGISYAEYLTGDEIEISFEKGGLNYRIYTYNTLLKEIENLKYTRKTINNLDCYIVDLSDVGVYQVYFNHNGFTYCFNHSNLDEILNLIESMEENK